MQCHRPAGCGEHDRHQAYRAVKQRAKRSKVAGQTAGLSTIFIWRLNVELKGAKATIQVGPFIITVDQGNESTPPVPTPTLTNLSMLSKDMILAQISRLTLEME